MNAGQLSTDRVSGAGETLIEREAGPADSEERDGVFEFVLFLCAGRRASVEGVSEEDSARLFTHL
jgi:hypothetical protein